MGGRWQRPPEWPKNAVARLLVEGREFFVTVHAARRWGQRVRGDARRELKLLRPDIERIGEACAAVNVSPPPWWVPAVDEPELPDEWLTFGPDIAMPLRDGLALTTLTRGALSPGAREWRRARRKGRAAARQALAKARGDAAVARSFDDKFRLKRTEPPRER